MKVLLIGTKTDGVYYHRLFIPYNRINEGTDIEVMGTYTADGITIAEAKQFDAIIFNRTISQQLNPFPIFAKCQAAKTKIIMDIDDYWYAPPGHPVRGHWVKTNFSKCCEDQLKHADFITTTHAHLRDEIIRLGIDKRKVVVCKNAIDPQEPQYNQQFTQKPGLMWQGSSTHNHDLKLLSDIEQPITLCGYHKSDEWAVMVKNVKKPKLRGGLPVDSYMNHYHDCNIALIPLVNNKFNRYKSELKMIEAGWANKAVIVSDIHPYTNIAKHMINCAAAKVDFKFYVDLLLKNKNLQEDLRGKLHEDVKQRYLINRPNERRLEILEKCRR